MERPTPPRTTFAQVLKDTFGKPLDQLGQQHNRKRSTRKRLILVGSGSWLWNPRSLSTKQVVGLVKAALPYGRAQAIIPLSADAVSMPQTLGA